MRISSNQANNIINSLVDVIEHDINFIHLDGTIIASTDKSRVASFHEGSQKVIETKKTVIIYRDDEYLGTKAGINSPVYFNGEIVAIIGITGQYEDIKKFASVIVKLTEILIGEFYYRDQREIRQENIRYLVELIINNLDTTESILHIAESLNIKLQDIKRIAILNLQEKDHKFSNMRQLIFNSINRRIEKDELIVNSHGDYVLFLNETDLKKLGKIMEYVSTKYAIGVAAGFSEEIEDVEEFYFQYSNTKRIADLAHKTGRYEIVELSDFDLELILLDLDEGIKQTFLQKVLGNVDKDTLLQWSEMLMAFAWNDGSINSTSEELFIHKNTLQYRLKKVKEVTGYDPRKLRDFTILYLATLLNKQ